MYRSMSKASSHLRHRLRLSESRLLPPELLRSRYLEDSSFPVGAASSRRRPPEPPPPEDQLCAGQELDGGCACQADVSLLPSRRGRCGGAGGAGRPLDFLWGLLEPVERRGGRRGSCGDRLRLRSRVIALTPRGISTLPAAGRAGGVGKETFARDA